MKNEYSDLLHCWLSYCVKACYGDDFQISFALTPLKHDIESYPYPLPPLPLMTGLCLQNSLLTFLGINKALDISSSFDPVHLVTGLWTSFKNITALSRFTPPTLPTHSYNPIVPLIYFNPIHDFKRSILFVCSSKQIATSLYYSPNIQDIAFLCHRRSCNLGFLICETSEHIQYLTRFHHPNTILISLDAQFAPYCTHHIASQPFDPLFYQNCFIKTFDKSWILPFLPWLHLESQTGVSGLLNIIRLQSESLTTFEKAHLWHGLSFLSLPTAFKEKNTLLCDVFSSHKTDFWGLFYDRTALNIWDHFLNTHVFIQLLA